MSLFSCLSPLSVKFLGFLLLLWKQTPSILPRKPGNVSLETMPRDTGHMLLRNHCMMVLKAQPFGGNKPQHQVSHQQHHQMSCGQQAPPSLQGSESLWKYKWNNFGPVSACILQWRYMDLLMMATVHFPQHPLNQLHSAMMFESSLLHDLATIHKAENWGDKTMHPKLFVSPPLAMWWWLTLSLNLPSLLHIIHVKHLHLTHMSMLSRSSLPE